MQNALDVSTIHKILVATTEFMKHDGSRELPPWRDIILFRLQENDTNEKFNCTTFRI